MAQPDGRTEPRGGAERAEERTGSRLQDPLLQGEGAEACILGNEAIVRGALEAGVGFASGYPGTPSSEITDSFARLAKQRGIVFEYSVNEKVAVEMAYAAALAGARSICAMKHLGLMVAGDPLTTMTYVGVKAGMVIVSAGDPSCRTSPNEHDQRHLGPMLHLPVIDPSTPARAHALTKLAFELSEEACLPVLLRVTTRLCHSRAAVRFGALPELPHPAGFVRDPRRYTPLPENARRMRLELEERLRRAEARLAAGGTLRVHGESALGVLASGAPAATTYDLREAYGLQGALTLLSLEGLYPLPEAALLAALKPLSRLLVVEELSPYLEDAIRALCQRHGLGVEILGKRTGHLPAAFEYEPEVIARGLRAAFELGPVGAAPVAPALGVPPRPPSLCPGCGHRAAYFAARSAFSEEQLYFNDIGCYTLGYGPPLETVDALLCMGAGFTLAAGVARVTGQRTVGFVGDSTFFHAGMPALLNAIKENVGMVAVILDNQITAMTGFQESPVSRTEVSIEAVVRALGATQVETVDSYDPAASIAAFRRAREADGLSVVVVRRACPVNHARAAGQAFRPQLYQVDASRCRTCGRAASGLRCDQCLTEGYERHLARTRGSAVREGLGTVASQAPCAARCPLSLCIEGYAGHIAAGEYGEALGHILTRTPLPESVCRVCHRPCETVCVRKDSGGAVAVNDLKRFVVEWADAQPSYPYQWKRLGTHARRVAVVGSGPAGLGAAHELWLRGYAVTVFDAAQEPGGVLRHAIPAYRLPREALERDLERLFALGITFEGGRALGRELSLSGLLADGFEAVFLGLGAQAPRRLELPGAGGPGAPAVLEALPYLRAHAAGAPLPTGRRVVVIGGGNAAVDAGRAARRAGATSVTLACLEAREAMPALPEELAAAEHEGVHFATGVRPVRLEAGGLAVETLGLEADLVLLEADQVLVAIGQGAELSMLDGDEVVLGRAPDGLLAVNPETGQTSHPRIFAGGDVIPGERMVTTAIASGQRAGWAIDRLLRGAEEADRRPPPLRPAAGNGQTAVALGVPSWRPRAVPTERDVTERLLAFHEVNGPLDETTARAEAARCLSCGSCGNCRVCIDVLGCPAFYEANGRILIEPTLCLGCGVCAVICPNQAIVPTGQA